MASKQGGILDYVAMLRDIRLLFLAFKAGDFFGDEGVFVVLGRLASYIQAGNQMPVGAKKFASSMSDSGEFEELMKEWDSIKTTTPKLMVGSMKFDPTPLIPIIDQILLFLWNWWQNR